MHKRILTIAVLGIFLLLLLVGCKVNSSPVESGNKGITESWKPEGSVELVAPASPGGGWDNLVQAMQQTLKDDKLVEAPIYLSYMPGEGGAVGWSYLNTKKGSGNYLAVNSSLLLLNDITGSSKLTYKDFTPLAMLQAEWEVVAVRKDSPYRTGKELFDGLRKDPAKFNVAVGPGLGNDDHVQFLMLAKAYGLTDLSKLKFTVYPGAGRDELRALLNGQVGALTISLGEVLQEYQAGTIRILGISSKKRLPQLPDVPTWQEQGIDMTYAHWRGIMGPANMTPEQIAYWTGVLAKMVQQPSWKAQMQRMNIDEFYMPADRFKAFLDQLHQEYTTLLKSVNLAS